MVGVGENLITSCDEKRDVRMGVCGLDTSHTKSCLLQITFFGSSCYAGPDSRRHQMIVAAITQGVKV